MSRLPDEKEATTTIRVPVSLAQRVETINQKSGMTRQKILGTAVSVVECLFENNSEFVVTRRDMIDLRLYENARKHLTDDPSVAPEELATLDLLIKMTRERLNSYREEGKPKVEVKQP